MMFLISYDCCAQNRDPYLDTILYIIQFIILANILFLTRLLLTLRWAQHIMCNGRMGPPGRRRTPPPPAKHRRTIIITILCISITRANIKPFHGTNLVFHNDPLIVLLHVILRISNNWGSSLWTMM